MSRECNASSEIKDEYISLIKIYFDDILRPVVQRGQRIDRDKLALFAEELKWKCEDSSFSDLPWNLQAGYKALKGVTDRLAETDDVEIEIHKDVLNGLFLLGIDCTIYGPYMREIYSERNPCRKEQYGMHSTLRNAERSVGNSNLLKAGQDMYDICNHCPFK